MKLSAISQWLCVPPVMDRMASHASFVIQQLVIERLSVLHLTIWADVTGPRPVRFPFSFRLKKDTPVAVTENIGWFGVVQLSMALISLAHEEPTSLVLVPDITIVEPIL